MISSTKTSAEDSLKKEYRDIMRSNRIDCNSELLSEKEKEEESYFICMIDSLISELNYNKTEIKENYMYYNKVLNPNKFCFITENDGVGFPGDIPFISLINPRINAMLGIQLNHPMNYKITSKGQFSYTKVQEERKLNALNKLYNKFNEDLKVSLKYTSFLDKQKKEQEQNVNQTNQSEDKENTVKIYDMYTKALELLEKDYNTDFISTLEIQAQHVLYDLIHRLHLKDRFRDVFEHLLISGSAIYRCTIDNLGQAPTLEICNPIHFYHTKESYGKNISKSKKAFYRKYMSKTEIINEFGAELTEEQLDNLDVVLNQVSYNDDVYWSPELEYQLTKTQTLDNSQVYSNGLDWFNRDTKTAYNFIPVYFCEWLSNNKVEIVNPITGEKENRYRLDRYEGVRIGGIGNIYLRMRKSPYVVRTEDDPYTCTLSFGGIYKANENSFKPESLVSDLKEIQDDYNMAHYLRRIVQSQAYPGGVTVDVSTLPAFLGDSHFERIKKQLAFRKSTSIHLIDSSQVGNTAGGQYGGISDYPSNIDNNLIQLFSQTIELCESDAEKISGINRQMLSQFEERDGLGVAKQAVVQSSLIIKDWFHKLDMVIGNCLTDLLELSRISFQEGHIGQYILNGKQNVYKLDNAFKLSNFSIYVSDEAKIKAEEEQIKQLAMELVKGGQADMKSIFNIIQSKGITEARELVLNDIEMKEKSELNQLKQQSQEQSKQLEELNKKVEELTKLGEENKAKELQLKEQQLKNQYDIELKKLEQMKQEMLNKNAQIEKQLAIEEKQLQDSNENNDEIKDIPIMF